MRAVLTLLLAAGFCSASPPQAPTPPQAPPVPAGWVEPGERPAPPPAVPFAQAVYVPLTYQLAPYGVGQACVNGVCYPAPYQPPARGLFRWR